MEKKKISAIFAAAVMLTALSAQAQTSATLQLKTEEETGRTSGTAETRLMLDADYSNTSDVDSAAGTSEGNVEYEWKVEEGEKNTENTGTSAGSGGAGAGKVIMAVSADSISDPRMSVLIDPEIQTAIYIKLGDIKGESSDDGAKGGNVEFEWKVEEGESAAAADFFLKLPPIEGDSGEKGGTEDINIGVGELQESQSKEIVILGSKIRRLSDQQKSKIVGVAPRAPEDVMTEADLALFAAAQAADTPPMESIAFNYGKIVIKYKADGKLFGFIPHKFTETVTLDTSDKGEARVTVKFPWYGFLVASAVAAVDIEETAAADNGHKDWINLNSLTVSEQAALHARAFSSLSNVLKTKHESSANSETEL